MAVVVATPAQAQERSRRFDIPAQPAANALNEWARQAGAQIVFPYDVVQGRRARAVRGDLTPREALARLTGPLGLEVAAEANGIVTLRGGTPPSGETQAGGAAADSGSADAGAMPDILVVGQRTLNADIRRTENDAQPYVVFDRADIQNSTATTIEEFLHQGLPMLSQVSSASELVNSRNGNTSSFNLRGLGTDETLILVDGRRIPASVLTSLPVQGDVNGIPLAAVERIEVLPTTASGIYGGSATGGVINIILRRDYSGLELRASVETPFDIYAPVYSLEAVGGLPLESGRTTVSLSASYVRAHGLQLGDRNFAQRARELLLQNVPATQLSPSAPPVGYTSNIASVSGANLALRNGTPLNSPITFVPVGYQGSASDNGAALVANAGRYNFALADTAQSIGARRTLISSTEVARINLAVRRRMTDWLDAFVDLSWSRNRSELLTSIFTSTTYTIQANAANNPFNQAVRVTTPALGGDQRGTFRLDSLRAAFGLIFDLPGSWRGSAEYVVQRVTSEALFPEFGNNAAATAAVTSGAIDVFRDTNLSGVDYSAFTLPLTRALPVDSDFSNLTLRVSGPLFDLPAGPVSLSTLAEMRREEYGETRLIAQNAPTSTIESIFPARSQGIDSLYAELRVPLVGGDFTLPFLALAELSVAGRWDRYKTTGSTVSLFINGASAAAGGVATNRFESTNPTIGLRVSPFTGLTFRASYNTGFLPPAVNQLVPAAPSPISAASAASVRDPRRGNEPLGAYTFYGGGNPNLRPEESQSTSLGMIFEPTFIDGLRISVDWTRIAKTDAISAINANQQLILDNEQYLPGVFIRQPAAPGDPFGVGRITEWRGGQFNIARQTIEAVDFGADYRHGLGRHGDLRFALAATYLHSSFTQFVPTAPIQDLTGIGANNRWKANASLAWETGPFVIAWTTRYFEGYWLNLARTVVPGQGAARIPSQTYHDVAFTYDLDRAGARGALAGFQLQLAVTNLFGREPPLDVANANFFSEFGNARLRTVRLSVRRRF